MSLINAAIRVAATEALKGRTYARDAVLDSAIPALEDVVKSDGTPVLTIHTDGASFDADAKMLRGGGELQILISAVITTKVRLVDDPNVEAVDIPLTDAGLELLIDAICRQVQTALIDPANDWAVILRDLCGASLRLAESNRGSNAREGLRLAGRELTFVAQPIGEPGPGDAIPAIWRAFLDACAESESKSVAAVGAALTTLLAAPDASDEAALQMLLGTRGAAASSLLRDPLDPFGDAPEISGEAELG